jgi:F-type H+-transporting ATPase subunit epsilon
MAEDIRKQLKLELIGPERIFYVAEGVDTVVAEAVDGEVSILEGHTSLIADLRVGACVAKNEGGSRHFAVDTGVMEVKKNRVKVFTRAAEESKDIDVARAERAMDRAKERLELREGVDIERATAALKRAMNRLKIAGRGAGA